MGIRVEGGRSDNVDRTLDFFKGLLRAFLAFLMHIWYYLAYFYSQEKRKKRIRKITLKKN